MRAALPQPDEMTINARCPRCGYDLRGAITSWKESCPIEGRCAECGLGFEWGELLNPDRAVPRWCVEYARGWGMWPAAIKTLLVLLFRPRKFWRELKMTHAPRWGRLAVLYVAIFVLGYLVFAGSVGLSIYTEYQDARNWPGAAMVPSPMLSGLLAAVNPFAWQQVTATTTSTGGWTTLSSPRDAARRARPQALWREVCAAVRGNAFIQPWRADPWELGRLAVLLAHGGIIVVIAPSAFLALPQSLRRAKVRMRHIARIGLYSVMFYMAALIAVCHLLIRGYRIPRNIWENLSIVGFGILVLAVVSYWSLACKHYLKLPHAWGVGVSMVVLAYAAGLFAVALVDYLFI